MKTAEWPITAARIVDQVDLCRSKDFLAKLLLLFGDEAIFLSGRSTGAQFFNRNAPARMRGKSLGLARHGAHLKYPDPSFFEATATLFPRRVDVRFTSHPVALPVARVAL